MGREDPRGRAPQFRTDTPAGGAWDVESNRFPYLPHKYSNLSSHEWSISSMGSELLYP